MAGIFIRRSCESRSSFGDGEFLPEFAFPICSLTDDCLPPPSIWRWGLKGPSPKPAWLNIGCLILPRLLPSTRSFRSLLPSGMAVILLTPEWHFIQNSDGSMELFNCQHDPTEKENLAANPEMQDVTDHLRMLLETRIAYSVLPWHSLAYLSSLDKPGASFIQQITRQHPELPSLGPAIGSEQSYFSPHPPSQLLRTHEADQDLLRTLPYH